MTGPLEAGEAVDVLEVIDPGLLLTVQDLGRQGLAADGVTPGGAADQWSLAVANLLAGNEAGDAALEATLLGPALRVLAPVTVALAGTMTATVEPGGTRITPGDAVALEPGDTLRLGTAVGARGYLAVAGGLDAPVVLGSRSTALGAGFGGVDGRALRPGDRLAARARRRGDGPRTTPARRWPGDPAPPPVTAAAPLRVLPGPHAADLGEAAVSALLGHAWEVRPASDRVGIRLAGRALPAAPGGTLASHGVVAGAVQVPPDGQPIVLGADHQPTGGYPVVAVVISADLSRLGQLGPGAAIAFAATTPALARAALLERDDALARAAARLGAARWTEG